MTKTATPNGSGHRRRKSEGGDSNAPALTNVVQLHPHSQEANAALAKLHRAERPRFEAAMVEAYNGMRNLTRARGFGGYKDPEVDAHWAGWLLCANWRAFQTAGAS
jgi:hypothetical protein